MKRVIVILSLFFAGIFTSYAQERCDTLKWKSLKTEYLNMDVSDNYSIGILDNAVINIDTLPHVYLKYAGLNISSDTFFIGETVTILSVCMFYADTGLIGGFGWQAYKYSFGDNFSANDIMKVNFAFLNLPAMINNIKEKGGIDLEEISYWKLIMGIDATSKDGQYSDSVFYAGADTSIFRVVRGGVGVKELQGDKVTKLQVYPNPAKNQLTIDCRDVINHVSTVEIYNVVGQLMQSAPMTSPNPSKGGELAPSFLEGAGGEVVIDISHLSAGMYFLKVGNKTARFVKE